MPAAIALAAALAAVAASTESTEFGAGSSAWNGLGELGRLAEAAGCPLEATERLRWDALDGHDVLLVLHPRRGLDGAKLAAFLRAGGRAIVADDADALLAGTLAPLGLGPGAPADAVAAEREPAHPSLLVAHPATGAASGSLAGPLVAPLTQVAPGGATVPTDPPAPVGRLVTNHPGTLRPIAAAADGDAPQLEIAWQLAPDAAVVVAGRLGRGRFVALSDASLLINNMLELDEDRAFAAALVGATCRGEVGGGRRDRLLLVGGDVGEEGVPPATLPGALDADGASLVERIDGALASLDGRASDGGGEDAALRESLRVGLGLLLVAATLALLGRALPSRQPVVDGSWTRALDGSRPTLGCAELVERHAAGALPGGTTLLAAVLREEVVLRLGEALAAAGPAAAPVSSTARAPLGHLDPRALERTVAARLGPDTARAARRAWRTLATATQHHRPPSARRLARMHRDATRLFTLLDAPAASR